MAFNHSKYNLERYHNLMAQAREALGGQCKECGSKDDLQFDHIDPSTKDHTVTTFKSLSSFWAEVSKCQLLCVPCHISKTLTDRGQVSARGTHGTLSSYRYCKCDQCKQVKAEYMKKYKRKPRLSPVS